MLDIMTLPTTKEHCDECGAEFVKTRMRWKYRLHTTIWVSLEQVFEIDLLICHDCQKKVEEETYRRMGVGAEYEGSVYDQLESYRRLVASIPENPIKYESTPLVIYGTSVTARYDRGGPEGLAESKGLVYWYESVDFGDESLTAARHVAWSGHSAYKCTCGLFLKLEDCPHIRYAWQNKDEFEKLAREASEGQRSAYRRNQFGLLVEE